MPRLTELNDEVTTRAPCFLCEDPPVVQGGSASGTLIAVVLTHLPMWPPTGFSWHHRASCSEGGVLGRRGFHLSALHAGLSLRCGTGTWPSTTRMLGFSQFDIRPIRFRPAGRTRIGRSRTGGVCSVSFFSGFLVFFSFYFSFFFPFLFLFLVLLLLHSHLTLHFLFVLFLFLSPKTFDLNPKPQTLDPKFPLDPPPPQDPPPLDPQNFSFFSLSRHRFTLWGPFVEFWWFF